LLIPGLWGYRTGALQHKRGMLWFWDGLKATLFSSDPSAVIGDPVDFRWISGVGWI